MSDAAAMWEAFAPGHVTAAFCPHAGARDPRARGSEGAGLVLELGVRARAQYRSGGPRRLRVTSDLGRPLPISTEVARRLLGERSGRLDLHLTHGLPVGQGFGTSAAGATATALAVGALFRVQRGQSLVTAHLADLFGGGGLGGVAAILGGGYELRRRAGLPPWGEVLHASFRPTILIGVVGDPIPSPSILGSPVWLRRIERARAVWADLGPRSAPEELFAAGERFTDRVGLASPHLRAVLRSARRHGAQAFQAMFGESFVALPRSPAHRRRLIDWLEAAGISTVEMSTDPRGARRRPVTGERPDSPPPRSRAQRF